MKAGKAGATGGVLPYAPSGQALDGGNFSAFIMAAMLDAQVTQRAAASLLGTASLLHIDSWVLPQPELFQSLKPGPAFQSGMIVTRA